MNNITPPSYNYTEYFSKETNDKKSNEAATIIQENWRGFHVKNLYSKPLVSDSKKNSAIAVGNDLISNIENQITTLTKHPAILATGEVQCLYNTINLFIQNGQLGKKPKIFLMDFDSRILTSWILLKKIN